MKKIYCLLILMGIGFASSGLRAQAPHLPGQVMVMLEPTEEVGPWLRAVERDGYSLSLQRTLVPGLNIHLLQFVPASYPALAMVEGLKIRPGVRCVQLNHQMELRGTQATLPNDPSFPSQWNLNNTGQGGGTVDADIDAPEAWDLATGGLSSHGDTVVVAIIDEGTDTAHQEFSFWRNRGEIPHNGKDDDRNGYVDDFQGWNAYQGNGVLPATLHGTHVAGIAGAHGNNSTGVAGINWNVQIMNVAGSSASEATVVEAYGYVIEQRKRYDRSHGAEGAFVVATNSSFGVNNGDPANFPIWCALYDSLGRLGILNAVSTANSAVNVDVVGDMPSTCPSDFVLSVTMTNNTDQLDGSAAYGPVHIDLGAPGRQILSTAAGGGYATLTGTSMASPHLAGAISLMMAAAGPEFMAYYKNSPDSAALVLKRLLLQSVDTLPTLLGKTVSGGRLNLYKALLALQAYSDSLPDCAQPFDLAASQRTDTAIWLSWRGGATDYHLQYRQAGMTSWNSVSLSQNSYYLQGLQACQGYEYRVAAICGTDSSRFSAIFPFESEGCCRPPAWLDLLETSDMTARFSWPQVYAAQGYRLEYREPGGNWNVTTSPDTFALLPGLLPCTNYEVRLGTQCDTGLSVFADTLLFSTTGCGFCVEGNYCLSRSLSAKEDWIARVEIDTLLNVSGSDNGYGDYTFRSLPLEQGQTYSLGLHPGFSGIAYSEYWRVWIDYNRDGVFSDPEERVFDPGMVSDTTVNGQFTVPDTLEPGPARMRISMRFSQPALPCNNFDFGEVEDYCVEILGPAMGVPGLSKMFIRLYPNPVHEQLKIESSEAILEIILYDGMGKALASWAGRGKQHVLNLQDYPAGLYLLQVRSTAGEGWEKVVKR